MTTSMRRITVVEDEGYHVRFYGQHRDSAYFSVKLLGDEEAEKAAVAWRDKREAEMGLSAADYGTRRPRAAHSNSKADTGVFVAIGFKRNRFYADVMGVLNFTDKDGKKKRKQYAASILKKGYHAAYVEALQKRCEMAELPLPDKVKVPKLTDDQIDILLAHGATLKTLTETTVVPWTGRRA
jgi:hypothetical protein